LVVAIDRAHVHLDTVCRKAGLIANHDSHIGSRSAMTRNPEKRMRRKSLSLIAMLAIISGLFIPAMGIHRAQAQDDPSVTTLFEVALDDAELPPSPVYVRLLRITMQPGSSSPSHTHPGPELWRVESGEVAVTVLGPTLLVKSGDEEISAAPINKEFTLGRGDQITFIPGTAMAFRNATEEETKLLVSVILPAGHQRPPGITYVDGQPAADAFTGITSDILGDGLADSVPSGTSIVRIERVIIAPGQPIPAESNPVLLSVAKGTVEFSLVSGRAQVTFTATPGPQDDAQIGSSFTLGRGDAVYFPAGMAEIPHPEGIAELNFYRLIVTGDADSATPVAADEAAVIELTGPAAPEPTAEPTEEATEEATTEPTAEPTEEATAEPTEGASGTFTVGQAVYVNETDVRLRDAATVESNIVTGLTLGQELVITGEAVDADDIIWWPVASPDDETYSGWVAEQFLAGEPIE